MRFGILGTIISGAKSLRLSVVLPLMLIGLATLGSTAVGVIGYLNAEAGLERASRAELAALAKGRADLLGDRLHRTIGDLGSLANSAGTKIVLTDMANVFGMLKSEADAVKAYFSPEGSTAEDRSARLGQDSQTMYGFRHAAVHSSFAAIWRNAGYGEVYILDNKGNIVYTVTKSLEFMGNVSTGDLADSGLGSAFNAATAVEHGQAVIGPFGSHPSFGGQPAVFVAQAIATEPPGPLPAGVVAVRLDPSFFDAILADRTGLGETGQTYLIDAAGQVLSDKPLAAEPTALAETIEDANLMAGAEAGLHRETRMVSADGLEVLAVAAPLEFLGAKLAVVAERSVGESLAAVDAMRNSMLLGTLVVIVLAAIVGIIFSTSVTRPIARLTRTMNVIAEGDHEAVVEGVDKGNEVGEMARAVEVFRQNGLKITEMTEGERAASEQRRVDRTQMMKQLQHSFGEVVDAAIAGDFSRRVEANFPDVELNSLAERVNNLVETVARGINETGEVLSSLARTDLTRRVKGEYQGAFDQLKSDTNEVAEKLTEIVGRLRDTSRSLKTATSEMLSGANDLSERTTKQAATIEETSAAMEQLASSVLQNAQRAKDASIAAAGVTKTAEESGLVMNQATEAMERITASSGKISNIIGLIDDIAFQTNLLALNASVEAARAGEAGKGFAVVAVEVRRLAQSAAEASSEVKALIEQSGAEVKGGSKYVSEAATRLTAMLGAARSSNELMDGIAKQSRDQASAIEEVNAAVRQMDEMTQHNAALVEQTNVAIEQTEAQASELDLIVDIFTIDDSDRVAAMRPAPAMTPPKGARGLQERIKQAARSYLSRDNTAVKEEWSEF